MKELDTQEIEVQLLLEAIYLKYGYDFRQYARASIKRRMLRRLALSDMASFTEMQHAILHDPGFFSLLLDDFSIHVTEMFRDPNFYTVLRRDVIPVLKTYPFLKIWHAGCATGEEVYSMAILLQEEGLYERTQIYATDFNNNVLQRAKDGIYPINLVKDYTVNYQKSGGKEAFVKYYTAKHEHIIMDRALKSNIIFANHNLESDTVFNEMNMILCRNVLIYFNRDLQDRVLRLFVESLCHYGFLCLGAKEHVKFSAEAAHFVPVREHEKIFRRTL